MPTRTSRSLGASVWFPRLKPMRSLSTLTKVLASSLYLTALGLRSQRYGHVKPDYRH